MIQKGKETLIDSPISCSESDDTAFSVQTNVR